MVDAAAQGLSTSNQLDTTGIMIMMIMMKMIIMIIIIVIFVSPWVPLVFKVFQPAQYNNYMGMIIIFIITIILYNYYYSTPTFTKPSQSNCTYPLRICHKLSFSAKFPHIPVYEGARPFRQKGWVPRKCS